MSCQNLIEAYEVDIQFPDVSGMELLEMLMTRSEIARNDAHLSNVERQRLSAADNLLLRQSRQIYAAIQQIADLAAWRRNNNVPITHWWWYLDVVAQLPVALDTFMGLTQSASVELATASR
ncbi:MAG TPA: hypothetical protein PKH77_15045 [Anaerolineae bacterium]|nr:hypothetical protein [Anaerolineae bacterium]